nr:uncharacterized protein LOC111425403 [Onthophagus taurus]
MGGCRCSFRNCQSATKTNGDLHFFHYPVKHKERCNEWIRNARRPDFFVLPDDQLRNKVVCDLHFEKCYFTNALRKRLVHNAVPTLGVGCEDEVLNDNSGEFQNIDILPANEDGTIFTLDTDSMQHKSDDPISTYSFKNGTLVPVYEEESTEPIVYTLDQDEFKVVPNFRETSSEKNYVFVNTNKESDTTENYEIVFNGETQQPTIEKKGASTTTMEITTTTGYTRSDPKKVQMAPIEYVYVQPNIEDEPVDEEVEESKSVDTKMIIDDQVETVSNENNQKQIENQKHPKNKYSVKKKVLKQINNHSRQIASLKKALLQSNLRKVNTLNLNTIKGKVHPTFLGALTINLFKKQSNFSQNESEFLTTLYKLSPDCYNLLKEKLHWNLPSSNVVEGLIGQKSN